MQFHDKMSPLKLKTFQDMFTKHTVKAVFFGRLCVIVQRHEIDMHEVLPYSLGPLPNSLVTADGSSVKTIKAKLLIFFEKGHDPVETVSSSAVWLYGGMAMLQALAAQVIPQTFAELADLVLSRVTSNLINDGG